MIRARILKLSTFLCALFCLSGCQQEELITKEFFLPSDCIAITEEYLNQSYFYLQEAQLSYELKAVSSVPLHLHGSKIIEISWLESHDIEESITANFNSLFRKCDVNDGAVSFEFSESKLTEMLNYLEEKGPHERLIIYIEKDEAEIFYTDGRSMNTNIDHLQNP